MIDPGILAELLAVYGGEECMIDPGILEELIAVKVGLAVARALQEAVLDVLEARFGPVPVNVMQRVKQVWDDDELRQLNRQAARCPDLETFRQNLGATAGFSHGRSIFDLDTATSHMKMLYPLSCTLRGIDCRGIRGRALEAGDTRNQTRIGVGSFFCLL